MKKLVFITTRLFWPTDSGRKVSLYYYCKGLAERCGYEIHLYSFAEIGQSEKDIANKPDFISSVTMAKPVNRIIKFFNLATKSLFCGFPLQCSLYYSKENVRAIRTLCENIDPDVIMVDMIRLAPYLKSFKKRSCIKILDLDDMLSLRYERQLADLESKANILGNYASNAGTIENKMLGHSGIKKLILKSESKRVRRAEIKYSKLYDKTIFVSDKEANEINRRCSFNKAYTVRLGVDYKYYSNMPDLVIEPGSLAFLGNLKVAANIDSLLYIINEILPRLDFDYKLHVIGSVDKEFSDKYSSENVIFYGRVGDVRQVIGRCKLFLSPIAYGTGIKTKILEAMAMGIPVITNTIGAEGIDGKNGVHFIVKDSADDIALAVNNMMDSDNHVMIDSARKLIEEKYEWEKIYSDLAEVVGAQDENSVDNE